MAGAVATRRTEICGAKRPGCREVRGKLVMDQVGTDLLQKDTFGFHFTIQSVNITVGIVNLQINSGLKQ